MSLTATNVGTAVLWAGCGAAAAWLLTWPVRRRSVSWLVLSVALTGTAASAGALLGAVHSMLLPMGEDLQLVLLTLAAGVIALAGAGLAARRIAHEHRTVAAGLADLATGRTPPGPVPTATRDVQGLQAQLHRTAAALEAARERERALESSRRELVAWISHDLRTPLAGLRAMTEALEDDLAADPALYYKQMAASVERLSGMVDDLFDLSRVQAGGFGRHTEPVNLDDLVSDCLAAVEPLATAKGVVLRGRLDASAIVRASIPELNRALTNIVANAIRHTPEQGEVTVGVGVTAGGEAEVSVQDECGGIPTDAIGRVFDVGFRVGGARGADEGGAGLGLAITRGIVEAHGGTLQVDNRGAGCRFRVRLPAGQLS